MSQVSALLTKLLPFLHVKVAAGSLSAALAAVVLGILSATGHTPDQNLSDAIVAVVGLVAGYLVPAVPAAPAPVVVPPAPVVPLPPA